MSSSRSLDLQEQIFALAGQLVPLLDARLGRSGGALQVIYIDPADGVHCSGVLGTPPNEKRGVYVDNARRKAVELTLQLAQLSTAPIADPEADPPLYGGGMRCSNGWILAFSGYPPEWDEALCVALAKHFGILNAEDEARIVHFYKNAERVAVVEQMIAMVLADAA